MFKSIDRANKEIDYLREHLKLIKQENLELKHKNFKSDSNVTDQDFFDMRLRAQKAEAALEAMQQSIIDRTITNNTNRHNILKQIEVLIAKL